MTWQPTPGAVDQDFLAYSETTKDDEPFLHADLAGTIAHVKGLHKAGLIGAHEEDALVTSLQDLAKHGLVLDPALEDVHMNIECHLTDALGTTGKKVHTGRSRNDQVATAITLVARHGLAEAAQAATLLAEALAHQATQHMETPWTATTHGQGAQPATIGFLLAAHAFRIQDQAVELLAAFDKVGESPLGCGAVAGTTLPLYPAYTADLLGLRPPRNALLATGCRDTVTTTVNVAAATGQVIAGLCTDLLALFGQGALTLPAGTTTGSSLMPQKKNPDILELARGKSHALAGPAAAVAAVTTGLGLGYMRDLQVVKPHLTMALGDLTSTLRLLAATVPGMTFAATPWAPGITATDEAEALVAQGVPFRDAYHQVAAKAQDPQAQWLAPDPARRASLGGPAPVQVREQIDALHASGSDLTEDCYYALQAAAKPFQLLHPMAEVEA